MSQPFYEPGLVAPERHRPTSPGYTLPQFNQPPQVGGPGGYPAAPWPSGYAVGPVPGYLPRRGNGMAVTGFVLSFVIGLLGLVFSLVGLRRSREPGRGGAGLARAGVVISLVNMALGALLLANGVRPWPVVPPAAPLPAPVAAAPAVGSTTVAGACRVILPALTGAQSRLQGAGSTAEMMRQVQALADTVQQQGAASPDPAFTRDTAALAGRFRAVLAAVQARRTPDLSGVEKAAEQVGYDCGMAGVHL